MWLTLFESVNISQKLRILGPPIERVVQCAYENVTILLSQSRPNDGKFLGRLNFDVVTGEDPRSQEIP